MIFKDVNNMETNTIIAEILKNKPKGTKLYSPLFGDVYLLGVDNNIIRIKYYEETVIFFGDGRYYNYPESEPLLFPSKEMRDWSKFAWKKGDVLESMEGSKILFDKWASEDYTKFLGKIKVLGNSHCYDTAYYTLASKEEALEFIKSVEEINNGKLNRETLEIEKTQPDFKDGDIVFVRCKRYCFIEIFNYFKNDDLNDYASINTTLQRVDIGGEHPIFKDEIVEIRLATDPEKKQLFDALAKEGKTWDSEKKEIVDLKPKVEFEPFDKVLVRDCLDEIWRPSFFARYLPSGREPYQVIGGERVKLCIPYEGNESLLGTTKGVEG